MYAITASRAVRRSYLNVGRMLTAKNHTIASLPDLPYDYDALEPVISTEIMKIHHSKHHQAYVNNYNLALEKLSDAVAKDDGNTLVSVQGAIRFNLGGHINHSIFWKNLAPIKNGGGGEPEGKLADAIKAQWGTFENFKNVFNSRTAAVQGSGWGWLGYNPGTKMLTITAMPNQDPLQPLTGQVPLLGVDVWEHAYYLQYKSARPDYLKAIWQVVNWQDVAARMAKAVAEE